MKFIQRGPEIELTNEESNSIDDVVSILNDLVEQMGVEKIMSTEWYDVDHEDMEKIIHILESIDGCVLE